MRFSQRQGITPSEKNIQLDEIDEDLRNGLWNIFKIGLFDHIRSEFNHLHSINPFKQFSTSLWHNFFKLPVDGTPLDSYDLNKFLKKWFFNAEWYDVYDFIEETLNMVRRPVFEIKTERVEELYNDVLTREFSAFRFIKGKLAPITNQEEMGELKSAIVTTSNFTALKGCNVHLQSALDKLSDKKNPDYRNSIKEAISAIESIAKVISANEKDSLGGALDKIKGKIKIHPSLEKGFKQIYGYTSDSGGIRHALTDEASASFEDAKFMLVSCSAFINYLIAKAEKSGIKF